MDEFTYEFPMVITELDDTPVVSVYSCWIKVTPVETPPGFKGAKINKYRLHSVAARVQELLEKLPTIEMNNPLLEDLVEPKNGFNRRDYLVDLRIMPLGNSKIIGDEYPSNTLNREPLLVTHGYEINIDILEIEVAVTFMDKAKGMNLHPFEVEVILTKHN